MATAGDLFEAEFGFGILITPSLLVRTGILVFGLFPALVALIDTSSATSPLTATPAMTMTPVL